MRGTPIEQLRTRIAAGTYAVDPEDLAQAILDDFALVRRVGRQVRQANGQAGRLPRSFRRGRPRSD